MHPFNGGVTSSRYTKKHRPLIWENMLGTVYARRPGDTEAKYFDFDWEGARAYAGVDRCRDLRTCKTKEHYQGWPPKGRMALWGIPLVD